MTDALTIEDQATAMEPEARRWMLKVGEEALTARGWTSDEIASWRIGFIAELDEHLIRKIASAMTQNVTVH